MEEYLKLFIDDEYPYFIDKYLNTKTLMRIKYVTQFCGSDYTNLYNPLFLYTRYIHSIVVAHITWHFTHDKCATIAALLHDVGTPCFAHTIDYVFGDFIKQESSEKNIIDLIKEDQELMEYLQEDGISLDDLQDLKRYSILEQSVPNLCADRLDGVLHTCYIWIHTHSLEEIRNVINNIHVLKNEKGKQELGFKDMDIALEFVNMVYNYAMELQGNVSKYTTGYITEITKEAFKRNLIKLEDLYTLKEEEIVKIYEDNFTSWEYFKNAKEIVRTDIKPDNFYVSMNVKKRNVIPLILWKDEARRITDVSRVALDKYQDFNAFHDSKYVYVKSIKKL